MRKQNTYNLKGNRGHLAKILVKKMKEARREISGGGCERERPLLLLANLPLQPPWPQRFKKKKKSERRAPCLSSPPCSCLDQN
jgi:hypothetical protein